MPTTTIRHTDKRTTIPTAELSEFVPDDDRAAKVVRYPRDPSLDPQLVWKGKDEQDSADLEVRAPAIYVQEKVAPKALIDDLQAQKKDGKPAQADLFADFDGVGFDELVAAYQHHDKQNWSNRFILGDSLLVMNSLAVRENLKGRVQCIYFDPPYGIKFNSNWQVSTRKREITDGKATDATRQPEQVKAFRDTWKLGIHSYLSYLRDRLVVARELLTESGSVFVQIGEDNVHLVAALLDEVYGANSRCAIVPFVKTSGQTNDIISGVCDFLVWYCKDRAQVKYRQLYSDKDRGVGAGEYTRVLREDGTLVAATDAQLADRTQLPPGARLCRIDNLTSQSMGREKGEGAASWFPVFHGGREFRPSIQARWKTNEAGMAQLATAGRLFGRESSLGYIRLLEDFSVVAM